MGGSMLFFNVIQFTHQKDGVIYNKVKAVVKYELA